MNLNNRKVFISFLGATNYGECQYLIGGQPSRDVRYVQEAMLEYYCLHGWDKNDCAYILLTDEAKCKNWENDGHRDRNTKEIIRQSGLHDCLSRLELPMQINPIENVPVGNDEDEIMAIFSKIFNLLQDGDELYFDITHGFRYLPMITLVLCNYSKFLKNINVKWIGYGNYEGRDKTTNIARVIDLTSVSMLQDWTTAAADFINNGNAASLTFLTQQQLRPILRDAQGKNTNATAIKNLSSSLNDVVNDFKYCRGFNIIEANNVKIIKESLDDLEECMIEPLTPVIEKIKESVKDFDIKENITNGFAAAEWCLKHDMSQQAATILKETVITCISFRNGLDYKVESQRAIANSSLNIAVDNIAEEKWKVADSDKTIIRSILANEPLMKNANFLKTYKNLSTLRNDLNHCGMRENPHQARKIKDKLEKFASVLKELIIDNEN